MYNTNATFQKIMSSIEINVGVKPFHYHIIRQSSDGVRGEKETLFNWHSDKKLEQREAVLTVIVCMTNTKTSMQIAGCEVFHYNNVGSSAELWNRSFSTEAGTEKLSVFCEQKLPRIMPKLMLPLQFIPKNCC